MGDDLSKHLAELEGAVARFASEKLSCLEATRLSYIQATLKRGNTYLAHDSKQLVSVLIEKAEKALYLLEIGINAEKENVQAKLGQIQESDEPRILPAKLFTLLRQEIQKGHVTLSHTKESQHYSKIATNEQHSETDLQSFRRYQVMFEKMALDRLLAKVMQQIPENAGPLNPERLVIRSFKALQDISPEYLSRLISYYESLLILQTVNSSYK
ncbi:MAG: hypothetical protein ACI8O8_000516 [Oleiphilaceae bacterium]|jgi:hypothetical protein